LIALVESRMKFFCGVTLLLLLGTPVMAHDIITTKLTYTRDISRILVEAGRVTKLQKVS